MKQIINFTKMHGAGNDYIYVNTAANPSFNPNKVAELWSRYHFGVGSDGLILIEPSEKADFHMRMFNNDGSEGMMCGNGIRCVGKYVFDKGLTKATDISIDTLSGVKNIKLYLDGDEKVSSATVNMGPPILNDTKQFDTESGGIISGVISAEGRNYEGTFVSMGNPHFVIFVDDINKVDLAKEGVALEHHPIFPQLANIEFAQILPEGKIRTRVWERGTGITMACGTGACATAVAAALTGRATRVSDIVMDGGTLHIEWKEADNCIYMTGPAATVFEGQIEVEQ